MASSTYTTWHYQVNELELLHSFSRSSQLWTCKRRVAIDLDGAFCTAWFVLSEEHWNAKRCYPAIWLCFTRRKTSNYDNKQLLSNPPYYSLPSTAPMLFMRKWHANKGALEGRLSSVEAVNFDMGRTGEVRSVVKMSEATLIKQSSINTTAIPTQKKVNKNRLLDRGSCQKSDVLGASQVSHEKFGTRISEDLPSGIWRHD